MSHRKLHVLTCTSVLIASIALSGCQLFSKYSRRDRFVSQVMLSTQKLPAQNKKRLIGKPAPTKDTGAVKLNPGVTVILKVDLPNTYQGHCQSLSIHLPKRAQNEADYQVWLSGKAEGPWRPIGRAVSNATFDIDDVPFAKAHFVKLKVHPASGNPLFLDAVQIRVHLPRWQPPLERPLPQQSPKVRERSLKHADRLIAQGNALFEQKKHRPALHKYLEALPWRRKRASLVYAIAASYHALDQHYQSTRYYRMAFRLAKPNKIQREEYGQSYYAMRLLPQAQAIFRRCIAFAPLYPRCYYHRLATESLYETKDKALLGTYRDAYRIVSLRTQIKYRSWPRRRLLVLAGRGRRQWKIVAWAHKVPLHGHLDWYLLQYRLFRRKSERKAAGREGLVLLQRFLKANPKQRAKVDIYRGIIYAKMGQISDAKRALTRAIARTKGPLRNAAKALRKGLPLEWKGQTSKALKHYYAAHKRTPSALLRHYLQQFP